MSTKTEQVRIEYMPLEAIQDAPRNPKRHEIEEIKMKPQGPGGPAAPGPAATPGAS